MDSPHLSLVLIRLSAPCRYPASVLRRHFRSHPSFPHSKVLPCGLHINDLKPISTKRTGGPAKLMQSLGQRYVQYVNRAYKRSGSLWEGRYKSSAVQAETYLFACMRYIELNPVRAGMVVDPAQYRWSSYRHNGLGQADDKLTSHPLYQSLGSEAKERLGSYRALFRSELDDEAISDIRMALAQSQPLGDDRFTERICAKLGVRRAQEKRGRPPRKTNSTNGTEEQMGFGF